jgi:hypothetical protein
VLPFSVHLRPGASLIEQVVHAARKAMISGQLLPGDTWLGSLDDACADFGLTSVWASSHCFSNGL